MWKSEIVKLSVPLVLSLLAQASSAFVDTILMGMLGVQALAGGGLGVSVYQFAFLISIGVLAAVANLASFEHGRGNNEASLQRILQAGLWVALVLSIVLGFALRYLDPFLIWLDQPAKTVASTMEYLQAVHWALFPFLAFTVLRNFVLGFGHAGALLRISIISAALNFPISYALMTGLGIWPPLGLAGIAYGTVVSSWLMFGLFCVDVYRKKEFSAYRFWVYRAKHFGPELKQLLKLGLPTSLAIAMEAGLFTAAAVLAGQLGAAELAAHQIALQCITVSFMFPLGISQAISVKVGQYFGAGNWPSLKRVARHAVLLGLACSTVGAILFWTIPDVLVGMFTLADVESMQQVTQLAVGLLVIAAVFQLVDGLQVITMGALRGLKLGMGPTWITIVGYWLIGFPMAWWLSGHYSIYGVWMGLGIGLGVTATMLQWCYRYMLKRYAHKVGEGVSAQI